MSEEEMLLLTEVCYAVEKGKEEGEEYAFALGELYRMYTDSDLNPFIKRKIWETMRRASFLPESETFRPCIYQSIM